MDNRPKAGIFFLTRFSVMNSLPVTRIWKSVFFIFLAECYKIKHSLGYGNLWSRQVQITSPNNDHIYIYISWCWFTWLENKSEAFATGLLYNKKVYLRVSVGQ